MLFVRIQMPSQRFTMVLSRLEAALARLEQVAEPGSSGVDAAELAALSDRHDRLRESTRDAIARIDRLIAGAD